MAIANRGPELYIVNIVFVTAAILSFSLRIFVRIHMVRAWGRDDWLMVVAMLFYMGYTTSSTIGIHYGTGRHHRDLSEHEIKTAKHCWYFCYLFYSISMICSKLSIGCLLLRISIRKLHTYIIYAAMMTSIVAGGTFFFVCLFQCEPVSYMWDKNQHGTCINNTVITALGYVYSIFSIVSDFTFTLIPGFLVWNLQLKMRTKLALVPLITMGCIASAAVIARLPFVKHFNSPDFLWATLDIAIWSSVEQGLAITAGSLATLRPLFYLTIHRLGFTTRGTSRTHPSHYGMSDPNPKNATLSAGNNIQADTLRPDKYHLSATVRTRCSSDDDSISRAGCFDYKSPENWGETRGHQRSNNTSNNDNESERSLRVRVRDCEEEDDNMHIMVSKSFYITDEERDSIISQGDRPYQ